MVALSAQILHQATKAALKTAAQKMYIDMVQNYPDYADQIPKDSAYIQIGADDIEVGFRDPSVTDLDGGKEGRPIIGIYKQRVRRHTRKLKSGRTIQVKDQIREYNGWKPIKTRKGNWYMAQNTPSIGGSKFFTKAYEDNFLGDSFNEILKQAIKDSL